jgi:hypothetical protein
MRRLALLIPFFFMGCSVGNVSGLWNKEDKCDASYFYKAVNGQNGVGFGVAGQNMNGENAQFDAAISKAIHMIAEQKGVTVKSVTKMQTAAHNGYIDKKYNSYSILTIDGNRINAEIVKACKTSDGKLYVLMKAY